MQDLNEPSDNDYDDSSSRIMFESSVLAVSVNQITIQDDEEVKMRWLEEACLSSEDEDASISHIISRKIPFSNEKKKQNKVVER